MCCFQLRDAVMRNRSLVLFIFILLTSGLPSAASAIVKPLKLVFEENAGQSPEAVKFLARTAGLNVFLTHEGAALALRHHSQMVTLTFDGVPPSGDVVGEDALPGASNYLVGNNPVNWRTGVRQYTKIRYREIYPGVDAVFYGSGTALEYDFVVQPEADLHQVALRVGGAQKLRIRDGDLVIELADGEVLCKRPITYQWIN